MRKKFLTMDYRTLLAGFIYKALCQGMCNEVNKTRSMLEWISDPRFSNNKAPDWQIQITVNSNRKLI